MNKFKNISSKIFLFYIPLLVTLTFVLAPFLWAVSTSLKRAQDVITSKVQYIPNPLTFNNFYTVWKINKFSVYFFNSLFIATTSVIFILVLSIANGYALSRFKFKGRNTFLMILLGTQLMPAILYIIPLFLIFKNMGLIDTPFALILFYIVIQVPFNTLLMKGFIGNIPVQIDEAAMVDGATRLRVIIEIISPVILPGIVATSAFAFIGCWNEFLVAFSFITSEKQFTIPIGLKFMIGEYSIDYPSLAAGSIIGLVPPVLLFSYIQKYLIQGLSSGSVKG